MRPLLFALAVLFATTQPASAHRLKLFAMVDDGVVTGYGFFIGGGRPQGAAIIIRDASGRELYRGSTDDHGAFSWRPPQPADFTLVIDARDGHTAEARITADRFAGTNADGPLAAEAVDTPAAAPRRLGGCPTDIDPVMLADIVDRSVDRAVSRQVRPLLEAYEAADGRARLNDIAGGVGMIVGIAGIAMWAASRRRSRSAPTANET
jgi:nickel transport protein